MSGAQVIRIIDGRTNNLTFRCSGATAQNFTFANKYPAFFNCV